MTGTHTLARFALLGLLIAALTLVAALPALAYDTVPMPDSTPWGGGECQAGDTAGRPGEWECVGTLLPVPLEW